MIDEQKLIACIKNVQEHMREANKEPVPVDAREIFTLFIEMVEQQTKVDEWIPVEEYLPETNYETVLVITDKNYYCVAVYTKQHGFRTEDIGIEGRIIAWMPLPEPYKEEENGKV